MKLIEHFKVGDTLTLTETITKTGHFQKGCLVKIKSINSEDNTFTISDSDGNICIGVRYDIYFE